MAVALNIFAAVALLFAGQVAISIHQTHAFSMYREFVIRGFIDEAAVQRAAAAPEQYDLVSRIHKVSATREEWWWEEEESLDGGENLAGGWQ